MAEQDEPVAPAVDHDELLAAREALATALTTLPAFAHGRRLEPAEAEVTGALHRAARPARHARRWPAVGAAAVVLLAGGGYAVPVTRAAMDDVLGAFTGYFGATAGDDLADAPGRALRPSDDAPAWVRSDVVTDRRLVAEAGGRALYAVREPGGRIGFALGDGVGISDSPEGWRDQLAGRQPRAASSARTARWSPRGISNTSVRTGASSRVTSTWSITIRGFHRLVADHVAVSPSPVASAASV